MIALQIEDNKDFTTKLLLRDVFDSFLLSKGTIVTGTTIHIDGHLNTDFYDKEALTDEDGSIRSYASWAEMKTLAFDRIKGKRLPLSFQFVLLADHNILHTFIAQSGQTITPGQDASLFLNIHYGNNRITCATGVSLRPFSLDKTIEHLWDNWVITFFQNNRFSFSIPGI